MLSHSEIFSTIEYQFDVKLKKGWYLYMTCANLISEVVTILIVLMTFVL